MDNINILRKGSKQLTNQWEIVRKSVHKRFEHLDVGSLNLVQKKSSYDYAPSHGDALPYSIDGRALI